jgi:hypothetical protein
MAMRYRVARTPQDMHERPRLKACSWPRLAALALLIGFGVIALPDASPVAARDSTLDVLRRGFLDPPADSRIMMRWWWFGPSVTDDELSRELRAMKDAGIGGVEIQPVYPVAMENRAAGLRIEPFLGEAFLQHLRHAAVVARDLGLRVDLTLGSGWPYGGPTVAIDDAAGRLRIERLSIPAGITRVVLPPIGAGETFIAAYVLAEAHGGEPRAGPPIMSFDGGVVQVGPAEIARTLLVAIAGRTGQMVKRAAVGAEGLVLNHYDRAALDRYLAGVGEPLLRAFAGLAPPSTVFCDSLEVYGSDWTPDFLGEFRRRRGYDLLPLIPLLATGDARAAAVRHDWGQTLTELLDDRFLAPLASWARAHDTHLRAQAYGTPPAIPTSATLVDYPEGEGVGWKALSATRWASSAAHVSGVPVASSETWTWLHSPAFRATPLDLKAEADRHFLQGVNQLVGHGWPYSAPGVPEPGWRFYAAAALNDHNPWWIVMPDVARALQRTSWLLRQGEPVNDVAVLLPIDDAWAAMTPGDASLIDGLQKRLGSELFSSILGAGFDFDLIDRFTLEQRATVEGDGLRIGPRRYSAIVLADIERLPPADLPLLERFARSGGTVIAAGHRPSRAPGFTATAADQDAVRRGAGRLFEAPGSPAQFVSDASAVGRALTSRLQPDVLADPTPADIGVVHRRAGAADVYFVANTSNGLRRITLRCRVAQTGAEWWDPVTGARRPLEVARPSGAVRAVVLELPPYGSGFVVFAGDAASVAPAAAAASRTLSLDGPWEMTVGDGAARRTVERLESWTLSADTRYFSGVVHYDRTFELDASGADPHRTAAVDFGEGTAVAPGALGHGIRAWLDGPVREVAVVWVNGTRAGSVWCPPYDVDVTGLLRPGRNTVRIDVANTAANEMAGSPAPDDRLLNMRYGVRFEAQDMADVHPEPSGLLVAPRLVWR